MHCRIEYSKLNRIAILFALCGVAAFGCSQVRADERVTNLFSNPQKVSISGYNGVAMEPFISRDGKTLLFNNSNAPNSNTDILYAERISDLEFRFKGEVKGVNTAALEGVPAMDRMGNFYFISTRSYPQSLCTIYHGIYKDGVVSGVEIVDGVSDKRAGRVNFDVDISSDGNSMYYVESSFVNGQPRDAKIEVAHWLSGKTFGFQRDKASDAIMKNVNTGALQYAACISRDEKTLFFTRVEGKARPVPTLFMATRPDLKSPFGAPLRVAAAIGFVEGPTLSPDEKSLYYHKRVGDTFTIYRVTRK